MSASAEILARQARYNRVERIEDGLGRSIGVKRLKPSQQIRVQEMAPGLEGATTVTDDNPASKTFGKTFEVPKISPLMMAAAVVEIDGDPVTFAKTRAELDAILDRLDDEGLTAVAQGLAKFGEAESGPETDGAAAAKNSQSTPRSDRPAG